jgi:hypothetical protein
MPCLHKNKVEYRKLPAWFLVVKSMKFYTFAAVIAALVVAAIYSHNWDLAISIVTPVIVTSIAKYIPKLPKWALPVSTPLIGMVLGIVLDKLGAASLSWFDTAKAGALAVFIRESWNQAVTKQMAEPDAPAQVPTVTSSGSNG